MDEPGQVLNETAGSQHPPNPPQLPAVSAPIKSPDIKPVGKRNMAAVFIAATDAEKKEGKQGRIVDFSDQEQIILKSFLTTFDYEKVAVEAQIKVESVKRILRRPNLKRYLEEIIAKSAIMEGTDIKWIMMELRQVWEGQRVPNAMQMEAMKQMGKILTPKGPGIAINVQQNSSYGAMSREATDVEWTDARAAAADGV
jgi:hypothetical protein